MKHIYYTFLFFSLSLVSFKLQAQDIHIAKYAGNKQAALSFTFDDGLREQYTILFPKMKELGIKGTFCLIGSRVEHQPVNIDRQTFSWEQAKEMIADGQEITSHGWEHKNVTKLTPSQLRFEVQHNDTIIYKRTGVFPRTYFYPGNRKSDEAVAFCSRDRVGTRTFEVSLGSKRTQEWFENYLKGIINKNEWGVTMTHGIRIGYDCFGDETRLWKMFDYTLSQQEFLWIATFHDVSAYLQERANTDLNIKVKKKKIVIMPKMNLNKNIFTVPLTLVLDFKPQQAIQDGKYLSIKEKNEKYLIDFQPSKGKISILK